MKNYRIILSLICLALSAVYLTACNEDDDNGSGLVELLSFGPSGVTHGEEIRIVGRNLDKVTSVMLPVNVEVLPSSFKTRTSQLIVFDLPLETGFGKIVLKTSQGDVESKTIYSPEAPIEITGMTEEVKPGNSLTITGEFLNFVSEVWFADEVLVTEFVSQSRTQLVVTVPLEAKTGRITLVRANIGPEGLVVESEDELIVTLPSVTGLSPNPATRGGTLTIAGEDLDLTKEVAFKGGAVVSSFASKTATEIVLTVPEDANQGAISLITYSGVEVESEESLKLEGSLPPLDPLEYAIYVDALENGWSKWGGWGGGSADLDNSDNVRDGEKSIKVVFAGGWGGAMQFGGSASTNGFSEFIISIYGAAGTNGRQVNLQVKNGADGTEKILEVVEGEWVEHKIPLSELGGYPTITEMFLQDRDWSGTLYVDHIGFR